MICFVAELEKFKPPQPTAAQQVAPSGGEGVADPGGSGEAEPTPGGEVEATVNGDASDDGAVPMDMDDESPKEEVPPLLTRGGTDPTPSLLGRSVALTTYHRVDKHAATVKPTVFWLALWWM